ncbi:PIG-L deacetylase family protein [Schlesneria paludicola]|uniref:PIG-L deacetylase family protein n=1 Tax=Schlesneria paludicola TaxID=360056 RepID=UPI00029A693A|nr:PIG-L deacetylase family protein [Schlesneria paludicola]
MSPRFALGLVLLLPIAIAISSTNWSRNEARNVNAFANQVEAATPRPEFKKRRIVIFAAHPEDTQFGCGGLIAKLTKAGHEVIIASASSFRGVRKIDGQPEADVRRREALESGKVIGATPHFFEYDHLELVADEPTIETVSTWLRQIKPDIVVTHWPLDTQPNRHVTSSLVWQSYLRDKKWSLYFFEGLTDYQTVAFTPDLFLDITDVRDIKKDACFCFQSQKPDAIWVDQDDVQRRRGEESGVRYAEAYTLAEPLPGRATLPVAFIKKKF